MNDMTHQYVAVSDGNGGIMHVLRPVTGGGSKKKTKRAAPDPIKTSGEAAAERLRQFIERVERLDEEIRGLTDDRKDVLAEAKAHGFDAKTIRTIVRLRQLDNDARKEADAILETYKAALGLE